MTRSTSENFESFLNVKKKLFIIIIKYICQTLIKIDKQQRPWQPWSVVGRTIHILMQRIYTLPYCCCCCVGLVIRPPSFIRGRVILLPHSTSEAALTLLLQVPRLPLASETVPVWNKRAMTILIIQGTKTHILLVDTDLNNMDWGQPWWWCGVGDLHFGLPIYSPMQGLSKQQEQLIHALLLPIILVKRTMAYSGPE